MENAVGVMASGLGTLVRWLLIAVQGVVLAFPVGLISYGISLIYFPAAVIFVGLVLSYLLYRPKGQR